MSNKLKARAFEWLRNEALYGTEARYAAVMLQEVADLKKATPRTEAGPSIEAINSARYVMYNARDFGEHEAILANEIMRLSMNASEGNDG